MVRLVTAYLGRFLHVYGFNLKHGPMLIKSAILSSLDTQAVSANAIVHLRTHVAS